MPDQPDTAELEAQAEALRLREDALRRREIASAEAEAAIAVERERRIAELPMVRAERERKAAAAKAKAAGPQRVRFGGLARTALFETKGEVEAPIPALEGFEIVPDEDGRFVEVVGLSSELEVLAKTLMALELEKVGERAVEAGRRAARCVTSVLGLPTPQALLRG